MIRTNLSTRPFYNERAVHVAIGLAALVVLALTAFNVTRIVQLSRQNTELSGHVSRDHAEADRLTREATAIRRTINQDELEIVAAAAREANELIDQRTFSWTAFFNYIEATLPPDVMLLAVRPTVKNAETRISMTVLSRRTEDIDEFIEKLEATGAFENVLPAQADPTDDGLQRAILDSVYTGPGAEPGADVANPDVAPSESGRPASAKPDASPDNSKAQAPAAQGGKR